MDCPACKKQLPDDSIFCQYCGTSLSSLAASVVKGWLVVKREQGGLLTFPVEVILDNKRIASLRSGETLKHRLAPGRYSVYIKRLFLKSNRIDFAVSPNRETGFIIKTGFIPRISFDA